MGIDLHKRLFLLVTGRGEYTQDFPYHGCALPTHAATAGMALAAEHLEKHLPDAASRATGRTGLPAPPPLPGVGSHLQELDEPAKRSTVDGLVVASPQPILFTWPSVPTAFKDQDRL